jgi:hypothetical protein
VPGSPRSAGATEATIANVAVIGDSGFGVTHAAIHNGQIYEYYIGTDLAD